MLSLYLFLTEISLRITRAPHGVAADISQEVIHTMYSNFSSICITKRYTDAMAL